MMYRFSFLFGLFALLIFSACQDPFAPQKPATIPAGKGSFSLSVAVARTILPAVPYEDALWYRFDFKPSPTGTIMQEDRDYTELADPFYLEPGTYSLTVTAYSDAGRTNPVVQGNSTNNIVIIEGESTGATIVLRAIVASGTGTFIYTVGIPESVSSATITITPWGETSPIINDPMDKNTGEGTYNLAAGYYHVRFILLKENENGETLTWAEILHIYSNLESSFAMNFTDADFYKTIYTVTFEYNDGSPEGVGSAFHGGKVTMPIQDLTRENYAFGGWYRDPACTGSPYDFDLPVINNITLYAKWIEKAAITIIITVEQMTDLSFDDIDGGTIYRNGAPASISFEYKDADTGSYSCEWTIDGVGAYAGLITLTNGSSCTVSTTDSRYNSPGNHPVYLKVMKNGVPYKKTIWVTIVEVTAEDIEDFGPNPVIHRTFYVPVVAGRDESISWEAAKTAIANGGDGSAENNKNYIINVIDDFGVAGAQTATFTGDGIKVSLRGDKTLSLTTAGNMIRAEADQTVILRGLTLKGRDVVSHDYPLVFVTDADSAFVMHSGTISGNTALRGGGVYVGNGTFTMHGGTISGNTSKSAGGGVYVYNGTFTMHSGTISDNTASLTGGGVWMGNNGTFTMNGGTISGNTANNSGGDTSNNNGGGVYVVTDAIFRIVNGTIYGNTEPEGLRNTAINEGAALYNGNTAEHGRFDGTGGAWKPVGNLTTRDSTITVVNGELITDPSPPATAEDIEDFGLGATIHGIFYVPVVTGRDESVSWEAAKTAIAGGGPDKNYIINVIDDFGVAGVTTATFTPTNIAVSLRGDKTLTLTGTGSLIYAGANQTVILRDLALKGRNSGNRSVVYVLGTNSAFVLHSGKISGNTPASNFGGGVFVGTGGAFTMNGGEISGNSAFQSGGGVYVDPNGTFTMNGGTISGNSASTTNGGGVYVNTGTVRIVNGTIYGNETTLDTNLRNNASQGASLFNDGGTAIAQYGTFPAPGNWKSNGTLQTLDETIIVENGILIAPKPTDPVQDQADFDGNAPDRTFTVSSLAEWEAAIAAIKEGGDYKNYVITVTGNLDVPGTTDPTFAPATNIKVSLRGSGTLSLDETSTGNLIRAGASQTVILRDLTLKGGNSGNSNSVVSVNGTDSAFVMHSGAITGNTSNTTATNGGGVNVAASATFTMHGGTISGNTANNGGGVFLYGTFTMYGGTISGNTASGGGGVRVGTGGTFRFVAGTIYGSDATPETLRNNAPSGAALSSSGTAERGTFSGETWTPAPTGNPLATTNNTIQ